MKKQFWVSLLTIFLLTFISVAYASFSSVLTITGEATVVKDTTAPTCGSWYLRDSSLTTQEAYDQNKFINAGTNTTWSNTNKTLFIECTDNMDDEYGCVNVDTVTTSGSGKRYFKDVKEYTTSIKSDSNTVTVTLKDAYMNERTCTLPVGGSNPYIDKEEPTITITRSAANKFTYSATDNMSSSVTPRFMVTTSSTKPALDDANWSSSASEVTIDNSAAKTYYVWAKDGVNITNSTISTYLLTKTQGTGTTLTLKYQNNSGTTLSTGYVLNGTQVYATATPSTGYNTALIKKDSTTAATGTGTNSVNTTITVNAATTISSSATANTYSIGYTMNGGPNPSTKPTSGTYNANVNISNPGSKSVTITPNANSSGATVGSAVVATQTFAGWTSTTMQGNAQSGSTTSNYAAWTGTSTKNTYFKNLRNDTGTVTMVANWNTSASTLPTLTAPSGYTCKWYDTQGTSGGTELGGSGDPYTPSATSGSTVNVYARCTANTYYVYYNQGLATGGWNATTYATQSRTYPNSTTLRTNSMTKSNTTANSYTVTYNQGTATGGWDATTYGTQTSTNTTAYTANGWTTGSTNTNDRDYANGASFGSNSTTNLTLYPNFTTSTTNGGVTTKTNSMTKSNSADSDSYTLTFKQGAATSAAPSAITNKKYTSYTANGWTTTSGSTSRTYANNTATGALSSNITLYPCFSQTVNQKSITLPSAATKSNTNLGTVTFNYNGSGAAATTSTAYTTYAFSGWYTASSGGTKLGNASATYTPSASIDVYPQFTSTAHSATFPSNPTRTGYTFAGWYTAASGGTQVTSYTGSSNVEYFAHWTANKIHLTLDPSPGSGGTTDIWYYYGTSKFYSNSACTAEITAITRPTKTGYTLANYHGDGTSGGNNGERYIAYDNVEFASDLATDIYKDATMYASWSANTYTIVYNKSNSNETGTLPSNQSATYDVALTLGTNSMSRPNSSDTDSYTLTFKQGTATSAAPSAITNKKYTSYTANGWATSANGSRTYTSGQTNVSNLTTTNNGTVNLYTSWTGTVNQKSITLPAAATKSNTNLGTVTFNYNGSGASATTSTAYTTYAFNGWYTASSGGTKLGNAGATYTPSASIDVYPQFSSTAHSATFPSPSRTGYTFAGWWTAASGGTQVTSYTGSSNVEYYAHWTPITYTIVYNKSNSNETGTLPSNQSATYDVGITLGTNSMSRPNSSDTDSYTLTFKQGTATSAAPSAITNKKYTSYTANGWATSANAGRSYTSGQTNVKNLTSTNNGTYNLYTSWSSTVNQKSITLPSAATKSNTNLGTVTFNYNGSGAASTTSTGYTTYAFSGWYTASSGGTKLGNAGASYTPSASIDVYPQFTGTAHSATFPTPTRTGYTFAGWWTAASGGTQVTSYTGTSAVEYFAHWTENTYSLTFDGVYNTFQAKVLSPTGTVKQTVDITSSSRTISNISYTDIITTTTVGVSKAIDGTTFTKVAASNNPTRTGYSLGNYTMGAENTNAYRYDGSTWYTDYNGSSGCKTFSRMASTQGYNATLTLTWTANVYTITLDQQSGSGGTATIYEKYSTGYYTDSAATTQMTTSANPITAPSRSGYTFGGYYTGTNGSGTQYIDANGKLTSSASTTNFSSNGSLYAKWTPNTYYVYYNQGLATGGWSTSTYATQSRTYPNSTTLRTNSMTKSNTTANSYTVTYNQGTATDGWSASTYGTQTSINTTTYTANGWTTGATNLNDPDYANGASFGSNNTTNLTLYPNFTSSTTNGGVTTRTNSMTKSNSADSDSYTLTFKQGTATSAAPSAITNKKYTSYTANGWTTTSGSTSRTYANNTATGALSSNITLYPCFSQTVNQKSITLPAAATKSNTNLGTVTFNYNGSGASATTSTAYTTYAFNGWYTASSGGTKLGNAGATYTPSASIDVYPQFTGTAHSATFPSPSRTGYTFAGWWTASSGGTQVTSYTGSSNVEYYAHWTPITYTVVYNKSNSNETGTLPSNQSATYDVALTLGTNSMSRPNSSDTDSYTLTFKQGTATSAAPSAITNKKYTSYTANGWATSANAGRSYTSGQTNVKNLTSTNNGTYNLYTSWSSTVNQRSITLPSAATKSNTNLGTVTFNYNGSGATSTTSTAYTTYAFSGWYTASSGGTKLGNASASYTPSASIDVYPQFTGTAHSATFPSSPTRTGYTFAGWYTAASGGTQVTSYTGSSNVEYYAHWTANTYTIAYTMNNGTDPNPKPTSGTYDSNVSIGTTSIPTKTVTITGNANGTGASVGAATVNSLTFNGWSTSSGAGLQGNAQSGSTTSNLASWSGGATTNKYFKNLRNGSGTVTLTANWSTTVTLPTLSKTGHTCNWYDTSGTSGGSAFTTTILQNAATSITIYARCTANTYNITLNQQNGSGGTTTIYEKYGDGYYLTNNSGTLSNKMSTTANGVTVPTRSGYTFGGYYTSTNGGGTQYIDASGKLTSSASATQFNSAGNLYAKWTVSTPATPTISGGTTKIYGTTTTTLTCANSTSYPSGITKKYQFGYATTDGGTPSNWTTESDANITVIASDAYVGQRWYSCRVRAYDGSTYSGYATSATSADTELTINNATLTFNANGGTGGGTVYTRTGSTKVYTGIRNSTEASIPSVSNSGLNLLGWFDTVGPEGGNMILNEDGTFAEEDVEGYTSEGTWSVTTNKTLYARWMSSTITLNYNSLQKQDFSYTGQYQSITLPLNGIYRLEAWGAQGGANVYQGAVSTTYVGGKGAYTSGQTYFAAGSTLYVYVGQRPTSVKGGTTNNSGGWNGGGLGRTDKSDDEAGGGGGGATDFRYFGSATPVLTVGDATSLKYRIMVAAGGAGNSYTGSPSNGGGLTSVAGTLSTGATQTSGGAFGKGTDGRNAASSCGNAGGGGGYWGGGGGQAGSSSTWSSAAGGSSYISGYTGCVAIRDETTTSPRYGSDGTTLCANDTTDQLCSVHFTGVQFNETKMVAGAKNFPSDLTGDDLDPYEMPDPTTGEAVPGRVGHGYARVTLESSTKTVTSGQPIGTLPLPYITNYTKHVVQTDEEDPDYLFEADVLYDIVWKDANDEIVDENTIYNTSRGNTLDAIGVPHEYSITYEGITNNNQWDPNGFYPTHYNTLDDYTVSSLVSGMYGNTYYKFLGWRDSSYPGFTIDPINLHGESSNKVLTASWETKSTFKVEYNANGGITTCPTETGEYGQTWTLCTDEPTYGNVQFLGWFTEPGGNGQIVPGSPYTFGSGNYDGDYVLYAHWDIDAIEFNYNIDRAFAAHRMIDTYYVPDWSKTFEFEIKFTIPTASKRYLLVGNYDNSAANALNLEVAQNNTIRVYVGKGSVNATFGSVTTNQEITVKALWNGTTQKLTVDVSGGGTGHYEATLSALTGSENRRMRIGAADYRASTTPFNTITIKNFIIREFYSPPLQDTIRVPDPAGHYLLFDGWTGTNGNTPQYDLTVPTNSEGLKSYTANWSTGVSFKGYSKTFSTSNQYIKFKNEVTVVYIDQARRVAYTRERVHFYRTNTGYNTYGQGSMTVRYNWSAGLKDWTIDLAGKKINENGINLFSENWNAYSIGYRTIPYLDNGTRSVTLGVKNFTHVIFSVSTPKNATFALPAIRVKPTE